jgi:hypothetical protein
MRGEEPLLYLGPEGRPAKISPARKGWDQSQDDPERRRCGTLVVPIYDAHFEWTAEHFELYRSATPT